MNNLGSGALIVNQTLDFEHLWRPVDVDLLQDDKDDNDNDNDNELGNVGDARKYFPQGKHIL